MVVIIQVNGKYFILKVSIFDNLLSIVKIHNDLKVTILSFEELKRFFGVSTKGHFIIPISNGPINLLNFGNHFMRRLSNDKQPYKRQPACKEIVTKQVINC